MDGNKLIKERITKKHKRNISKIHCDDSSDDDRTQELIDTDNLEKPKHLNAPVSPTAFDSVETLDDTKLDTLSKSTIISDSEVESEDDVSFVGDEDPLEDFATLNQIPEEIRDSKMTTLSKWTLKICLTIVYMAAELTPGIYCEYIIKSPCDFIASTRLFRFCVFLAIITASLIFGSIGSSIVIWLITKMPFLGAQLVYYVTNARHPLKWSIITFIALIAWVFCFKDTPLLSNESNSPYFYFFLHLIICLLGTSAAFLIKAPLMRIIAIRYHRRAYYNRVKKTLFHEYILGLITEEILGREQKWNVTDIFSKLQEFSVKGISRKELKQMIKKKEPVHTKANINRKNHAANQKIPFWKKFFKKDDEPYIFRSLRITEPEILGEIKISNGKLSGFIEFLKNNNICFNRGIFMELIKKHGLKNNIELSDKMNNVQAIRALSRILFVGIKNDNFDVILKTDFYKFFKPHLAEYAFSSFEGSWDEFIDETQIFNTVIDIFKERNALKLALNDAEKAIDKLDGVITLFLMFILVPVYFIIYNVDPSKVLVSLSSTVVALGFAVGSSVQTVLQCIVFLFVTHPFDIGDKVAILDASEETPSIYTVTKLQILNTELKKHDNSINYFDNIQLMKLPIINLRRSPDQIDLVELHIKFDTSQKKLKEFEQHLGSYLNSHSRDFYTKFEVEYKKVEECNRMTVRLWIQHRSNFSNRKKFRERRSRILLRVKKIFEKLEISYETLPQNVYVYSENEPGLTRIFLPRD